MFSNRSKFVFYYSYDIAFHNLVKYIIEHLSVLRYAQNCSCENRIFPNPADLPYSAFSRVILQTLTLTHLTYLNRPLKHRFRQVTDSKTN